MQSIFDRPNPKSKIKYKCRLTGRLSMNNLKFLLQTNTPTTPKTLTILGDKVTLFKRSTSH